MQLMVLGMHRSGTSALARVLNLMGVYFGPEGISTGANEENPKGFWERRDVRALNDSTLHAVGCDWNRVSAFDAGSLPGSVAEAFRTGASNLILEMDAHRPWFIKEPRLCLLLTLWLRVLEAPVCVHIHRHPVEVAASLLTRNEMPMPVGLALWEKYVSSALTASAGLPSVSVSHHRLMTEPMHEVERLFAALVECGVPALRMPSRRELGAFIDPGLYRERSSRKELRDFAREPQVEMFKALEAGLSQAPGILEKTSQDALARLAEYESLLPPLQPKPTAPAQSEAVLREKVVARDQENKILRESVARYEEVLQQRDEQHTRESVVLGQLQATISHHERDIEALAGEVRSRDARLVDQADVLGALRGDIARLEAEAATRTSELEALRGDIVRLEAEAATRTGELEGLRHSLGVERDATQALKDELTARDRLLEENSMEMSRQDAAMRELEAARRKTEQSLEERFREIAALSRRVLEQDDALREFVATQATTAASLESRTRELDAAQQALDSIRGSWLWKLAAPLRAMRRGRRPPAATEASDLKVAMAQIESSGLFDRAWYLGKYEDVARSGMDPLEHYLRFGAIEERNPGDGFDTGGYLRRNPDVRDSGINPLLHYAIHGKNEGRLPK